MPGDHQVHEAADRDAQRPAQHEPGARGPHFVVG